MAADNRSLIELPKVNLEGVLVKLPLPSLLACCCVSKSLSNLIRNSSDFARMHLAKSKPQLMIKPLFKSSIHLVDLDTDTTTTSRVEVKPSFKIPSHGFRMKDSCNGLLLLESENNRLCLCNPVTGEYTLLPESETLYKVLTSAIFYCPKTHHFEVLAAAFARVSPDSDSFTELEPSPDADSDSATELNLVSDHDTNSEGSDLDTNSEGSDLDTGSEDQQPYSDSDSDSDDVLSDTDAMAEIFVKGSDSWQSLGKLPFSLLTVYDPCHLDSTVHWICADVSVPNLIVFFNFETHEFGEIPGPAHVEKINADSCEKLTLLVLGDRLCIFKRFTSETKFDVWVMKEYGVKDSWSRQYVIDNTVWDVPDVCSFFIPVICRNNKEVVMVSAHGYLLFYDLLRKKGRIVIHRPLQTARHVGVLMHTPSFLSMRDVVRGSNLEVVKVTPRFDDPRLNPHNYLELAATWSDSE